MKKYLIILTPVLMLLSCSKKDMGILRESTDGFYLN
jgi:hypothetical protein